MSDMSDNFSMDRCQKKRLFCSSNRAFFFFFALTNTFHQNLPAGLEFSDVLATCHNHFQLSYCVSENSQSNLVSEFQATIVNNRHYYNHLLSEESCTVHCFPKMMDLWKYHTIGYNKLKAILQYDNIDYTQSC